MFSAPYDVSCRRLVQASAGLQCHQGHARAIEAAQEGHESAASQPHDQERAAEVDSLSSVIVEVRLWRCIVVRLLGKGA